MIRLATVILACVLFQFSAYSQLNVNGSDFLEKRVADSISKAVEVMASQIRRQNTSTVNKKRLDFMLDTFRIETYFSVAKKRTKQTDLAVLILSQEALAKYDLLLNKHYRSLLEKVEDKSALVAAEKAWIAFRDKEIEYNISTFGDDYSKLGSLDKVWITTYEWRLTKQRVIDVFNYLIR